MDSSERNTFKDLCMALEGLESKNLNEDAFKVTSSKLVEYVNRYKKVSSDPGYKPQPKPKDNKDKDKNDPIESDAQAELTNKLSKEKMKNIELRDKLTVAHNKLTTAEKNVKDNEVMLEKLKEEKQKLLKENIKLSENARKTQKTEAIPFKKIDEMQDIKSKLDKAELLVVQKEKELAVANSQLSEAQKEISRKSKA